MDFLKNIEFKEAAQTRLVNLEHINTCSNIPRRFSNARLGDSKIDQDIKRFATESESDKVLLLTGDVGTGKTTKLCGAMHERAFNGQNAGEYVSCRTLCAKIRSSKSFAATENEEDLYRRYSTVDFLVIDEFGRGDDEKMELNFVSTILALRYDNMLRTAIGTNLSAQSVKEVLGDCGAGKDIIDRLSSVLVYEVLTGESLRKHS